MPNSVFEIAATKMQPKTNPYTLGEQPYKGYFYFFQNSSHCKNLEFTTPNFASRCPSHFSYICPATI